MYYKHHAFFEKQTWLHFPLVYANQAREIHKEYLWAKQNTTVPALTAQIIADFPKRSRWFEPKVKEALQETIDYFQRLCTRLGSGVVETDFFKKLVSKIIAVSGSEMRQSLAVLYELQTPAWRERPAVLNNERSLDLLLAMVEISGPDSANVLKGALSLAKKNALVWQSPELEVIMDRILTKVGDKQTALHSLLGAMLYITENLSFKKQETLGREVMKTIETIAVAAPQKFTKLFSQALFVTREQAKNWKKAIKEKRHFCLEREIGQDLRFYPLVRRAIYDYAADTESPSEERWDKLQVKLNTPWLAFRLNNSSGI